MSLLNFRAGLIMLALSGMVLFVWRRRGWQNYSIAGFVCLLSAGVPWAGCMTILGQLNEPTASGTWLATMCASVLYASGMGFVLGGWDLLPNVSA